MLCIVLHLCTSKAHKSDWDETTVAFLLQRKIQGCHVVHCITPMYEQGAQI